MRVFDAEEIRARHGSRHRDALVVPVDDGADESNWTAPQYLDRRQRDHTRESQCLANF